MTAICASLPYETDSGIAQTEAKWKLLAASMCFQASAAACRAVRRCSRLQLNA
jgi:hypothetical protein